MSSNVLTKKLVDDLIKYLASGGRLVVRRNSQDLKDYLSPNLARQIRQSEATRICGRILRYMRQQALVSTEDMPKGQYRLRLTPVGMQRAHKITIKEISLPRPKRWDRRWRVVFFDIPETKRQARNNLVAKLKDLGFYQLQKSIWVHPFPCLIEIEFLKRTYDVTSYVTLAEITKIDRAPQLIRHFRAALAKQIST
ncbi:hypothetical protein HY346_01505 [Candidatus Microgenomates bacterium]|nr:hypothetical protein [Candidatus Microgenomates bacterium]